MSYGFPVFLSCHFPVGRYPQLYQDNNNDEEARFYQCEKKERVLREKRRQQAILIRERLRERYWNVHRAFFLASMNLWLRTRHTRLRAEIRRELSARYER